MPFCVFPLWIRNDSWPAFERFFDGFSLTETYRLAPGPSDGSWLGQWCERWRSALVSPAGVRNDG